MVALDALDQGACHQPTSLFSCQYRDSCGHLAGKRGSNPFDDSFFLLKAYLLLGEEASVHQVFNELPKTGTLVF